MAWQLLLYCSFLLSHALHIRLVTRLSISEHYDCTAVVHEHFHYSREDFASPTDTKSSPSFTISIHSMLITAKSMPGTAVCADIQNRIYSTATSSTRFVLHVHYFLIHNKTDPLILYPSLYNPHPNPSTPIDYPPTEPRTPAPTARAPQSTAPRSPQALDYYQRHTSRPPPQ